MRLGYVIGGQSFAGTTVSCPAVASFTEELFVHLSPPIKRARYAK